MLGALPATFLAGMALEHATTRGPAGPSRDAAHPVPVAVQVAQVVPSTPTATTPGVSRLELQGEIAAAVGNALDERARAAALLEREGQQPTAPTAENLAALEAGRAVLAKASQARLWTRDDASELRQKLQGATPEQRRELQMELTRAIDSGEIAAPPHAQ